MAPLDIDIEPAETGALPVDIMIEPDDDDVADPEETVISPLDGDDEDINTTLPLDIKSEVPEEILIDPPLSAKLCPPCKIMGAPDEDEDVPPEI